MKWTNLLTRVIRSSLLNFVECFFQLTSSIIVGQLNYLVPLDVKDAAKVFKEWGPPISIDN